MIVHTPLPPSGTAPDNAADTAECSVSVTPEGAREGDPLRQLFHRHANHLNSAQARHIHARLKHRLFAEDSELG